MIRIVHTSDVHLDTSFVASGMPASYGNKRRQGLRDVFHSIVRRAAEWPADAMLIAGDLFEWDRMAPDTPAFLKAEFESLAPVPVFIAPGNHDPAAPNSPYVTESWPGNVVVFCSPRWSAHPLASVPLTVHGFGFDGPDISCNPFGALRVPQDGRVHVAVAHGSEKSHQPSQKTAYAPFAATEAAAEGLAYLALGHFHAMTPIVGDFATRMYYSGAPEGLGFGDAGLHGYLEVEIEGDAARVRPVTSGRVVWATHEMDCSQYTNTQQVIEAVRALRRCDEGAQAVRIVLKGVCPPAWQGRTAVLYDAVAGEFDYLDLVDETEPLEDYESLAREDTSLGAFVRRINEEIRDTPDESRRCLLLRAREVGLAAYRGRDLSIRGCTGE